MDIQEFSKRMVELMPQCIRGFAHYEYNYLSRGQITLPQFWALEYISRKGDCLMSDLAGSLNISRPAATGLVDRLISQKLVSREDDSEDRRVVKIHITAKGKKIVSNIWDQKKRTIISVFSKLSAQDRRQHLRIFEQVVDILKNQSNEKVSTLKKRPKK